MDDSGSGNGSVSGVCKEPVKRGRRAKNADPQSISSTKKTKKKSAKQTTSIFSVQDDELCAHSDDDNVVLNLKIYPNTDNNMNGSIYDGADFDGHSCLDATPFDSMHLGIDALFNMSAPMNPNDIFQTHAHTHNHNHNHNIIDCSVKQETPATTNNNLKIIELLKDFEEKNKHNEWPSNTSIHCYWCCHKFNNTPFGIPIKYIENKFYVYGCFCSLECCAAYNLESKDSADDIWERMSLINILGRKLNFNEYIKPAPSKLALKIFGGHMEIEDFRMYCKSNKIINVNFPPMLTLTQQLEEINEADVNNEYRYIPIDTERINKYKEKIKLKRAKPLTNFRNTLDHTMNLKYGENEHL